MDKNIKMDKKTITEALRMEDFTPFYKEADRICFSTKGNIVNIRAIIEFSSYCMRNCIYCGLNCNNNKATRYRMEAEEIVDIAGSAIEAGYRTIVLQGGEDPKFKNGEILKKVIKEIKAIDRDVAITLSAGELDFSVLAMLREAGAGRYLLRHETADPVNYEFLHPNHDLRDRVATLKELKRLGYETGAGFMIGLPNETVETLADNILLLKDIGCHMAGIGPFISHPDTSLSKHENGSLEMTKRCLALSRIALPEANLPVTTAVGVLSPEERKSAFSCGANVIMRKVNKMKYKKAYDIYPSAIKETDIVKERLELEELIRSVGKEPR